MNLLLRGQIRCLRRAYGLPSLPPAVTRPTPHGVASVMTEATLASYSPLAPQRTVQVRLRRSGLRAPFSESGSGLSRRTFMNNPGQTRPRFLDSRRLRPRTRCHRATSTMRRSLACTLRAAAVPALGLAASPPTGATLPRFGSPVRASWSPRTAQRSRRSNRPCLHGRAHEPLSRVRRWSAERGLRPSHHERQADQDLARPRCGAT
jgi:hypothetical protein